MLMLPLVVPVTYAAELVVEVPDRIQAAVGAGVLAIAGVRLWDQERVRRRRLAWRLRARPQWAPSQDVAPEARRLVLRALQLGMGGGAEGWRDTVEQLHSFDQEIVLQALEYTFAVDALALFIAHDQQWPDKLRTRQIAASFAHARPGSGVDGVSVARVLTALVNRRSVTELSGAAVLLIPALALGSWLLAETPLPAAMQPEDFLREIERALAVEA